MPDAEATPAPLRDILRAAYRGLLRLHIALNGRRCRYALLLAHPRSGSTLLTHIMANHPEFLSAGESFITYRRVTDLRSLFVDTCARLHRFRLRSTYVMDKVVYDNLIPDELLRSQLIAKCVILIRSPESTLKSMVRYFKWDESLALNVYRDRLETLARQASVLGDRAILLEYEDLVANPEAVLGGLSRFFGISPPFDNMYETGTARHIADERRGDDSINILAGQIIRTPSYGTRISAMIADQALRAFDECRAKLRLAGVQSATQPRL